MSLWNSLNISENKDSYEKYLSDVWTILLHSILWQHVVKDIKRLRLREIYDGKKFRLK